MTENIVDELIGQYCKVIIDELNKTKASVFYGILKDVDHTNNFLILESSAFPIFLNMKNIVAIKPSKKKNNQNE